MSAHGLDLAAYPYAATYAPRYSSFERTEKLVQAHYKRVNGRLPPSLEEFKRFNVWRNSVAISQPRPKGIELAASLDRWEDEVAQSDPDHHSEGAEDVAVAQSRLQLKSSDIQHHERLRAILSPAPSQPPNLVHGETSPSIASTPLVGTPCHIRPEFAWTKERAVPLCYPSIATLWGTQSTAPCNEPDRWYHAAQGFSHHEQPFFWPAPDVYHHDPPRTADLLHRNPNAGSWSGVHSAIESLLDEPEDMPPTPSQVALEMLEEDNAVDVSDCSSASCENGQSPDVFGFEYITDFSAATGIYPSSHSLFTYNDDLSDLDID